MRRTLIRSVLPLLFSLIPLAGAGLLALALPSGARRYYLDHLTALDMVILGLGGGLFVVQMVLAWRALRGHKGGFDERPDPWLSHLAQAAEWFPLLGLLGTVAGILQTFAGMTGPVSQQRIVALYAPAITATGSGLMMALINILPGWTVLLGRQLIEALGGGSSGLRGP